MNDEDIHQQIERLVAEEHELFDRGERMTATDRTRLGEVNVKLDKLWDLLRQRRAREEFGQDPERTRPRSSETVEEYLQ